MAYHDDQEPGPRWQHPLGGYSTERNYGHDDLSTPHDYNRAWATAGILASGSEALTARAKDPTPAVVRGTTAAPTRGSGRKPATP